MSIPDYSAGLVFGLTGDNQQQEFEKCFQSSDELTEMGQQVWKEFSEDNIIGGLEALSDLVGMVQPLVTTCSSDLQNDVAEITEWA